jgi:hypothetical protein
VLAAQVSDLVVAANRAPNAAASANRVAALAGGERVARERVVVIDRRGPRGRRNRSRSPTRDALRNPCAPRATGCAARRSDRHASPLQQQPRRRASARHRACRRSAAGRRGRPPFDADDRNPRSRARQLAPARADRHRRDRRRARPRVAARGRRVTTGRAPCRGRPARGRRRSDGARPGGGAARASHARPHVQSHDTGLGCESRSAARLRRERVSSTSDTAQRPCACGWRRFGARAVTPPTKRRRPRPSSTA